MTEKKQKDHRGRPRAPYQTQFPEPSLVVKSDAQRADIKHILKKYDAVGIVDHLNYTEAQYLDVTKMTDFAEVFRTARQAEFEFMQLPSKVREAFDHDVANWLDAANDPEKRAALAEKGIIPKDADPPPTPDAPVDGPPPAPDSEPPSSPPVGG